MHRTAWVATAAVSGLFLGVLVGFGLWGRRGPGTGFALEYPQGARVRVERVVDGDTVVLDDGTHVRYRGCDTPELFHFARMPRRLAEEALARNRALVEGCRVRLFFPAEADSLLDSHGRLIADIYLEDAKGRPSELVNEMLVREGLAKTISMPGCPAPKRLKEAEEEAKSSGLGIWARTPEAAERRPKYPFVAGRYGKYVHRPGCRRAARIKPENKMYFLSVEAALGEGLGRCGVCLPEGAEGPPLNKR